ncbi:decarboxylating 6-phosphogluconate dehydrogenase [Candidatus Daviesbacteria bacterium]|nr:decarboxylating 6-phosphogluconate dehydrogenase [Candidatus Daviesbacteria bacterium]
MKKSISGSSNRLFETIGVEDRGNFYDGLGALRDVGQNHLLQMLALVTMNRPRFFETNAIREKRAEILKTLKIPSTEEIKENTFHAQYKGYLGIKGVDPNSATETYFKIRAFLNFPVWQNVPVILESGKRLKEQRKEIEIIYKHVQPCLCPPGTDIHFRNKVTISLEPENSISINFWSKKPGLGFELEKRSFSFLMHQKRDSIQYTEEYEKLLFDAIAGDQTLFVSTEEVAAMWQFIDPIISGWQENLTPLKFYSPDTDQPIKESMFIDETKVYKKIDLKKEIGVVGLGKMGANIARHLIEKDWQVVGFNRSSEPTQDLIKEGLNGAFSLQEFMDKLSPPRLVWLMIPAGKTVDEIIFGKDGLVNFLKPGDIVLDGGNSFYRDSVERYKKLKKIGINFLDVGVSGGPEGARYSASLMVGGERKIFEKIEPLFADLAKINGYQFFDGAGAGHFVKMIHNGIEYGMMQSITEGFNLLKSSDYKLDLTRVTDVYNHGSVIESRLIGWLKDAFELHGQDLKDVSGTVSHTGEGEWTVKTAREQNLKLKVIEDALKFRIESQKNPSYAGKILSALREQFGGHKK